MKQIYIDDVAADSILATNLMNDAGAPILVRGTKLTEGMLNRLRKMGVPALMVETGDAASVAAERKELLQALEYRFAGTENNRYLRELKRLAVEHLMN